MQEIKVFCNGSFDLVHIGHLRLLEYAKSLGGVLLVAIDSDERITKIKGLSRPINTLDDRIEMLQAIKWVDGVTWFGCDDGLRKIIKEYKPDIMVKGEDYIGKQVIGSEFCKRILYVPRTWHSTTKTIQSITNR